MACIYLKHPVHGTKVATMQLEVDADLKNGWSQYNPTAMNTSAGGLTENIPAVYNKLIPAAPARKAK